MMAIDASLAAGLTGAAATSGQTATSDPVSASVRGMTSAAATSEPVTSEAGTGEIATREVASSEAATRAIIDTGDTVSLAAVFAARRRIAPFVRRTPLIPSAFLSARAGGPVHLKLESLQVTHSFKARGALNAALSLREAGIRPSSGAPPADPAAAAASRLVTASSGNHGRALSHAARLLGFACTVFAASSTPRTKLDAIRANGADLVITARDYDEAERDAKAFAHAGADSGAGTAATAGSPENAAGARAVYISPYNDPRILAATGTIAIELFEELPDLDTIVVPLGGGGLISGIAAAAKAIKPGLRVIGVEAVANPAFHTIRRLGMLTPIDAQPTLADGLSGNVDTDSLTIALVSRLVDDIVLVEEADIARTVRHLAVHERIVAEGAGAITSAAISLGLITPRALHDGAPGRIAAIVSGSNIDDDRLSSLMNAS